MKNDFLNWNPTLPKRDSFVGTLQVAWDSTSLSALKECPYKYYLSIVCGIVPMGEAAHLKWGILYHAAIERYDYARAQGKSRDDAIRMSVKYALTATWEARLNRPWISGHEIKNRFSLIQAIVDYLDWFDDSAENFHTIILPNGDPAVELSFNFNISYETPLGSPYKLCGHIDRLARQEDSDYLYILDKKSTGMPLNEQYWCQYSPNNQISLYNFSGQFIFEHKIAGIIIDAVQISKTKNGYKNTFERRSIPRTQLQLDEWYRELDFWLSMAETFSKQNYWPKNERACVKGFSVCEYLNVCSNCPSTREDWMRTGFGQRSWDPMVARGE
jgi:hypothetical protein